MKILFEFLSLILQSISYQFQYFSSLVCEISGGGCLMKINESSITSFGKTYDGSTAMFHAFFWEFIFLVVFRLLVRKKQNHLRLIDSDI
jgi:hypothetical protein